ncbi:hypothetical protein L2E82_30770 [Cichorium intybus]|uniref:Uncharacterized protein n=1 Tax=Cichorium intybus TaxID=13427 RepID=A0ACB9D1A4_CICIN|nr:hypothetical protein L2E82_30770 [Cichorium intybus]
MNGGDEANTDRNHKTPAPAIPINPVGHQGSEARRSLDIPIEENGENQGNFNSSGKGGEINNDPVINMTQLTSELPGTEADKTGCNFGPFEHLVPMRCFNPFLSTEPLIEAGNNPNTDEVREVEATIAIGEKLCFLLQGRIDDIEKLISGNGDTIVDQ